MTPDAKAARHGDRHLVFLFPLVWRPEKVNFARRFELLSERARGDIFALSRPRENSLPIGRFRFHSLRRPRGLFARVVALLRVQVWLPLRLLRRGSVDCIIAYDPYGSGLSAILLKYLLGARLIVELNGDHHQHRPSDNPLKNWVMGMVLRATLARADAIKVVNTSLERYATERFPGTPVFRFLDFVVESYFRSLEERQGDYLLSVGHPFEYKGVAELITAFQRVARRHPSLKLRVMGYCPPAELEQYRRLAGGHAGIEFVEAGWIEDVGEQMRHCYAVVVASHFDAAPRVLFEAMTCRKPVVATRTNGALDYVSDGETGLLCNIRDVDDLEAKLEMLVSDPLRARRMGEAGFTAVERNYSERCYVQYVLEMLDQVLGERSAPRLRLRDDAPRRV